MSLTRCGLVAGLAPVAIAFAAATSDRQADRAAAAALRQLFAEVPAAAVE